MFSLFSCPSGQETLDRFGSQVCLDPGTRCIVDEAGLCVATESNPEFCTGDNCVCSDDNGCIQTVIVGDKNFIIVIFVSLIILFRKLICFTDLMLPLE